MSANNIILAYCLDNIRVAEEIERQLSPVINRIEHVYGKKSTSEGSIPEQLQGKAGAIVLIISDNYIKSAQCMNQALRLLQERNASILPVVINGQYKDSQTGEITTTETKFDRVSDIIQYINYWQDQYLDLRKQKRSLQGLNEEKFNAHLKVMRNISSEVGEFLRLLRSVDFISYEEFTENHFESFFQFIDDRPGWEKLQSLQPGDEESNVAPIPDPEVNVEETPPVLEVTETDVVEEEEVPEPATSELEVVEKEEDPISEISPPEFMEQEESIIPESPIMEEIPPVEIEDIPGIEMLKKEIPFEIASSSGVEMPDPEDIKEEVPTYDEDELVPERNSLSELKEEVQEETDASVEEIESKVLNEGNNDFVEEPVFGAPQEEEEIEEEESDEQEESIVLAEERNHFVEEPVFGAPQEKEETENGVEEDTESNSEEEEEEEEEEEVNVDEIIHQSLLLFEKDEIGAGLNHLLDAANQYPGKPELGYHYALALAQYERKLPDAVEYLEGTIETHPEYEDAYFLLGELAEIQKDFPSAIDYYRVLTELNAEYPDVHYRLGIVLTNMEDGDYKEAADQFKKAIKNNSDNPDVFYQYAVLLNEHSKKDEKAIKYFRKTLDLQPDHPFAWYDLALLYHQLGKRSKARKAYLKAIITNPELKTPENDMAFKVSDTKEEELPEIKSELEVEEDNTIKTLKDHIKHLETLLAQTEAEKEKALQVAEEEAKPPKVDKVVFITGATSGIGKATATIFAENGYRLILTGQEESRLDELKQSFEADFGTDIKTLAFNVKEQNQVSDAIHSLGEDWQNVDILINNAGKIKSFDPIHEGNLEQWDEMIDINLRGLLYVTRLVSPYMVARRSGHIINVNSTLGKEAHLNDNDNLYSATKLAVEGLTKAIRLDLHSYNIKVGKIAPTHVEDIDVAKAIYFMVTQPAHVNIEDIFIQGLQQAHNMATNSSGRLNTDEEE